MKKIIPTVESRMIEFAFTTKKVLLAMLLIGMLTVNGWGQTAPLVEWQKHWQWNDINGAAFNSSTEQYSGEDWLYSVKKRTNTLGVQTGYVCAGYGGYSVLTSQIATAAAIFNEGSGSYFAAPYRTNYSGSSYNGSCDTRDAHGLTNLYNREMYVGTIELRDVSGNVPSISTWTNSNPLTSSPDQLALTVGEIDEVIQSTNKVFYYVVGEHRGIMSLVKRLNGSASVSTYLNYNPTSAHPNDNFYGIAQDLVYSYSGTAGSLDTFRYDNGHTYVAKIRAATGDVIWENLYGDADFSTNSGIDAVSEIGGADGSHIIQSTDSPHDLYICTNTYSFSVGIYQPFALRVDTNGVLITKRVLSSNQGWGRGICQVASGKYAAVSNYADELWLLDASLNNVTWGTNPLTFSGDIWDLEYLPGADVILVPFIQDCPTCTMTYSSCGYDNGALGTIYAINPSDGSTSFTSTVATSSNPIYALDTRIMVTPTSDGGFAAVTTVKSASTNYAAPTSTEAGSMFGCPIDAAFISNNEYFVWDNDTYISAYNSSGTQQWSEIFDAGSYPRTAYPAGDLRHSECMFAITQGDDGSILVERGYFGVIEHPISE